MVALCRQRWQWCIFSVCLWQFWSSLVRCRVHLLSHRSVSRTACICCGNFLLLHSLIQKLRPLHTTTKSQCKQFPKYVREIVAVEKKTVVVCMNDNAFSQFQKCSVQESWGCIVLQLRKFPMIYQRGLRLLWFYFSLNYRKKLRDVPLHFP